MPPIRKQTVSYVLHKQSGRGRAVWYDALGVRQQKLLPGPFNSSESLAAKARLELELVTSPTATAEPVDPKTLTVAELLIAYLDYAERHYRDQAGNPTDEVRHLKTVMRHVRELYGYAPVTTFGPMALKAVRQKFVELKWSRKSINARVERIRRIFRWGVSEELVSPLVYQALTAVAGLERGRTAARETQPVDPATVAETLPHLNRHVAGLVLFQQLTGCRPGEACIVRRCDIDTGGTVWLYKPAWVKELDDADARLELVVANLRDELSPLEIGRHALTCVPPAAGGRGNKGGLSAYAARIGKSQQQVSLWRQGAEVAAAAIPTSQLVGFRHRADHLDAWPVLAPLILAKAWSVKDAERAATKVAELFGPDFDPMGSPWWNVFLPFDQMVTKLSTEQVTAARVRELIGVADETAALFPAAAPGGGTDPRRAEWEAKLKAESGCASWNPRRLRQLRDEVRNDLAGLVPGADGAPGHPAKAGVLWRQGLWEDHLDEVAAGTVSAVVTDPPFGMNYVPPSSRHRAFANDQSPAAAADNLAAFFERMEPRWKPEARAFVCCSWICVYLFEQVLIKARFNIRAHFVWVKPSHGTGDLTAPGRRHELILYATRGLPDMYDFETDVLEFDRVDVERHPTEKPQGLFERLLEIGTVAGDLVVDPYGGVGTTAAVAQKLGRRCWSCELDEGYFRSAYPEVSKVLAALKRTDYKRSAWVLQNAEATLVIGAICGRLMRERPGLTLFTVHDSFLVAAEDVRFVRAVVEDEFGRRGVKVRVRVKP